MPKTILLSGTVFLVEVSKGYGAGMVTHSGTTFNRSVFSKRLYDDIPTSEAVASHLDCDGISISAILVRKGFSMGLFVPIGIETVPAALTTLPLFLAGQFFLEYDEATLREKQLYETAPPGREVIDPNMCPPYLVQRQLEKVLCQGFIFDFKYGLCRKPEEIGTPPPWMKQLSQ